ncbi:uncharacterized protein LAJ45_03801 [Morchella importuna]|uniref:Sterol desaturase family n=1 Tax=Morchella conica CCBAS932 TaxID=1392247 RepID=A0A3N4KBU0_9PEZI|nr:uncharacterized protein LAJ45_03801 [Morchella importuna]KAH8151810.1 hypothetical protein LAJ45_03801 [Morchella importuna]RPB07953.1 sterol desaturase family [Morchella conica CCBAS932]
MLEALLSLSGLTLLSTSVFTSWSTSLNLLFFYLTWSTLLLSQAPLKIEVLGTLAVRLIFFWIPSLLFLLFDTLLPSLSQDFKIRGAAALPNPRKSWKVVAWAMFNMLLGAGIQAAVETFLIDGIHWKSALRVSNALPMPGGVALDLLKAFLLREVLQYYIHRFVLHQGGELPQHLHMKWQHSVASPWAAVAHYDHPLPWLLWKFLPVYLPAVIFRFHILTYFLFLAVVSLEEAGAFSGYTALFFSALMSGAGRRVEKHFGSKGKGNFSTWGVMDWIHGTTLRSSASEGKARGRGSRSRSSRRE